MRHTDVKTRTGNAVVPKPVVAFMNYTVLLTISINSGVVSTLSVVFNKLSDRKPKIKA